MADFYLVDGYNLIHALGMLEPSLGIKALEQSRLRLLQFLETSLKNALARVTVVFDAQNAPGGLPHRLNYHGITVLFAANQQTADDLIESLLDEHATPKSLFVVSNDNRLKTAARQRDAHAWTDVDLLDFIERKSDTAAVKEEIAGPPEERDKMSPAESDHWIQEFKAIEKDPAFKEFFDLDRFED